MGRPTMFMLAGPNGAGKSTLYETVIKPRIDAPFINADIIQRDELKDPSMTASYKAAEIAEARRRDCLAEGRDFVSESTFSHPSKLALIEEARAAGFRVVMYHVNVRSADLSVARVERRTKEGGHDVPEEKIRERYERNQALIKRAVLLSDRAFIYDNSALNKAPERAIDFKDGLVIRISDRVPTWARELYAKELEKISPARLNPAAASFADAKAIVAKIGGPAAELRIPNHGKNAVLRGELVGETAEHWLQRVDTNLFVAHFKSAVAGDVRLHRVYDIAYPQRGRGRAQEFVPDRPARAQAFQAVMNNELSRETALKRHPELRPAFNELAVAKLKHATEPEKLSAVADGLQRRLNVGEIPAPTRRGPQLSIESERNK
jgi:predicted ABC-type ATPase